MCHGYGPKKTKKKKKKSNAPVPLEHYKHSKMRKGNICQIGKMKKNRVCLFQKEGIECVTKTQRKGGHGAQVCWEIRLKMLSSK